MCISPLSLRLCKGLLLIWAGRAPISCLLFIISTLILSTQEAASSNLIKPPRNTENSNNMASTSTSSSTSPTAVSSSNMTVFNEQPKKFTLFPKMALELRKMVWSQACMVERVVDLCFKPLGGRAGLPSSIGSPRTRLWFIRVARKSRRSFRLPKKPVLLVSNNTPWSSETRQHATTTVPRWSSHHQPGSMPIGSTISFATSWIAIPALPGSKTSKASKTSSTSTRVSVINLWTLPSFRGCAESLLSSTDPATLAGQICPSEKKSKSSYTQISKL